MKRIFSLSLLAASLLLSTIQSSAQTTVYGNEWVEAGRTYYKFKVAQKGIFRISQSALSAAGVPSGTAGSAFKMYRDGQEVALVVSTTGALGGSDYIEFAGAPNDGKTEAALYPSPADQPNDRISLHNDTATYFLTFDGASNHLRYTEVANNIPGSPGAPAAWCWGTSGISYRNTWAPGRNNEGHCGPGGANFMYSAQYEPGEGYINGYLNPATVHTVNLPTPGSVAASVGTMFYGGVVGKSWDNEHQIQVQLNNTPIWDTTYGVDETKRIAVEASVGQLPAVTEVKFVPTPLGSCYYDQWGVSFAELQYTRNFDAAGASFFAFRLPASAAPYLEFQNLGNGGSARLYDLTTRTVMNGVMAGNTVRFYVPASLQDREMVLVGSGSSYVQNASVAQTRQFTAWTDASKQGAYIILTHNRLMQPVNGSNQVEAYANYRRSAAGGGYTVAVADVEEIYDQFGYGVRGNPLALRRFFNYAYETWNPKPHSTFIVGHGLLYHEQKEYNLSPSTYNFPIVPSWGDPGSDVNLVNFGPAAKQMLSIGRLSIRNAEQLETYLVKVKRYEEAQKPSMTPTVSTEAWKKSVLHIAGASDRTLQVTTLLPNLHNGENIIRDTMTGYKVRTVAKNNTNPVDPVTTPFVDSIMNAGMQMLVFHGHAGPAGFDYNINTPENYTNGLPSANSTGGRYPVFLGLGCDVAQIFALSTTKTISERYVDHRDGGAIAMMAMNSIGYTDWHDLYLKALYTAMARTSYGKTIGDQQRDAYNTLTTNYSWSPTGNKYSRRNFTHLESMLLQGDPVLRIYSLPKPDYHVATTGLSTLPVSVSTELDSFRLKIATFNLGKAPYDTAILVKVEHTNPANQTSTVRTYTLRTLPFSDTTTVWIPVNKSRDLGLNRYRVTIDAAAAYDETSETNNTASIEVFIFSDDLVPVYPYKYGIVSNAQPTLKASSLNPFRKEGRYRMELDTTEAFNSPAKQSTTITAPGGVVRWTPATTLRDSTVYYWRTAFDSTVAGQYNWSNSSFVYMAGAPSGWNQSHYFQLATAGRDRFDYSAETRRFDFQRYLQKFTVQAKLMRSDDDIEQNRYRQNDVDIQRSHCPNMHSGAIQIMVVDSLTGKIWENDGTVPGANGPNCNGQQNGRAIYVYEFALTQAAQRDAARRFLDSIPAGNYILVKNSILYDYDIGGGNRHVFYVPAPATAWMDDTTTYGSGKSLYHTLKGMGFSLVDSYKRAQPFYFITQKGVSSFQAQQEVGADSMTALSKDIMLPGKMASGSVTSVEVGPAQDWKTLQWRSRTMDGQAQNDTVSIAVYGVPANSAARQLLYQGETRDTSLAWISAQQYPRLQLEWSAVDTVNRTSPQLDFWRVLHTPLPEVALVPSKLLTIADSLEVGQMQEVAVAIENIGEQPMDSLLVSYKVIGADGVSQTLARKRYKPLVAGDTLHARLAFDPAAFVGRSTLFIEANPDEDQPELFHPNNLGYLPFRIDKDDRNPLIDVTFDGVHILDRDIVSSKPFIKVMLKDDNRYLALDDTGLIKLYIHHPNDDLNTRRLVPFDGTTCKFVPAQRANDGTLKNEAYIEYRPTLTEKSTSSDQHIFELAVAARDKTGNSSGPDYRIAFEVVYESSITRLLNYPNPFSTSTAFLFTLTGSEIPAQFKIQVMTVSGKVVREVTKAELGPLHIGRNITEYKWDGRDQYGQVLGNGVYLYRVVTALATGEDLEHRESGADKFFQKGWGKMYIMR